MIGVSPDSVATHVKFAAKYSLDFPLLADTEHVVQELYGVRRKLGGRSSPGVERSTFLIDREGVIRRVWRGVKVPGHADEVLAAAAQLG